MRSPLAHALLFYPVFVLIGLQSSFAVVETGWYRLLFPLSALLLMVYFAFILKISDARKRALFAVGMLVCAFGENLCVYALDLYHFAGAPMAPYSIPPYVILGHGFAIWSAVVLGEEIEKRWGFSSAAPRMMGAVLAITLGRAAFARDLAGLVWFPMFLAPYLLCKRREDKLLLLTTYLLATGLEWLGVGVGAWDWHESTYWFNALPLQSPPAAVGGFYALADWVTLALVRGFGLDGPQRAERDIKEKASRSTP